LSFRAYKDLDTGKIGYAFEGEEHRLDRIVRTPGERLFGWDLFWEKLPPNPSVILATSVFMTEMPYLDSLKSIYELDRMLNIEAEQDREDKAYQEMVKHI